VKTQYALRLYLIQKIKLIGRGSALYLCTSLFT